LLAGAPAPAAAQDAPARIPSIEAVPPPEEAAPTPPAAEAIPPAPDAAEAPAAAAPDAGAALGLRTDGEGEAELDLLALFRTGGPIGCAIAALSVVMLALALRFLLDLRASRLAPPKLRDEVAALLRAGRLEEAQRRLAESDSLLGEIGSA